MFIKLALTAAAGGGDAAVGETGAAEKSPKSSSAKN